MIEAVLAFSFALVWGLIVPAIIRDYLNQNEPEPNTNETTYLGHKIVVEKRNSIYSKGPCWAIYIDDRFIDFDQNSAASALVTGKNWIEYTY